MNAALRRLVLLPAVAILIGAAGCSSSATSPASPSDASRGATIQGTVETGAGASSAEVSALSSAGGISVTVVGVGLATTTDSSGRFVLQGVPGGRATLRFQGQGVDGTIELGGLADGQTITITVRVSGSRPQLVPPAAPAAPASPSPTPSPAPAGKRVEFDGTVDSVTPPTLMVSGRTVVTNAETKIKRGDRAISLGDLKPGDRVEVEGTQQADGSVLASKIKLEDGEDDDDQGDDDQGENEVEFTGRIDSLAPPALVVAGRPVTTDASTRIRRGDQPVPLSSLKVGEKVEVEGILQSGVVLGRKIKVEDDDDHDEDDDGDDS